MKQFATILALFSVITVAVFGFSSLHQLGMGHETRCFASLFSTSQVPCPETDPVGFAGYHLDAFRSFSLGTLVAGIAVLLALFLFGFAVQAPMLAAVPLSFGSLPPVRPFWTPFESRWHARHQRSPSR